LSLSRIVLSYSVLLFGDISLYVLVSVLGQSLFSYVVRLHLLLYSVCSAFLSLVEIFSPRFLFSSPGSVLFSSPPETFCVTQKFHPKFSCPGPALFSLD